MSKRNEYRFSIQLDETDESHRLVASYLNGLGRKKARIIVKAVLAYLNGGNSLSSENAALSIPALEKQESAITAQEESSRMISLDMGSCNFDQAEMDLMRRNFDKLGNGD